MGGGAALIWAALLIPSASGFACLLIPSARIILRFSVASAALMLGVGARLFYLVLSGEPLTAGAAMTLRVDALSAYHLVIMALVFLASSVFAVSYFDEEISEGRINLLVTQRYGALWNGSMAAMALVLVSNNLGLMWVGMEATTVLTAFLIGVHGRGSELEAMWKYLIVCSTGVAFAFMGTLLCAAAASSVPGGQGNALLWTHLRAGAAHLNPTLMRAAFVFLVVGYGTKAGLAPMHTWLPDAHSQAPAPVSAMFSGFMLSAAFYCILRYVPLVEAVAPGFATDLLVLFGLVSVLLASAFIIFQRDAKRLLAYSSVEHMGVIAIGVGLGPLGIQAALLHTLNHSLAKPLAFFSVGRLGQSYGSHDMEKIRGALTARRTWGAGLLGSMLTLIGVAPLAMFMSEFQVLGAAVSRSAWWVVGLFLFATAVIFVVALKRSLDMVFGSAPGGMNVTSPLVDKVLVVVIFGLLLMLGVYMPSLLHHGIVQAAAVLGGLK